MSSWELLRQTCWWSLSNHWSLHITSLHLLGFVWYGGLETHQSYLHWDNGLALGWHQAIILTNWTSGTNFSAILIKIHPFSFKKIKLNMLSGKWWTCFVLNLLNVCYQEGIKIYCNTNCKSARLLYHRNTDYMVNVVMRTTQNALECYQNWNAQC